MGSTIKDLRGFGRALKRSRINKGLTQEQVGKLCGGLTGDTISKLERGTKGPKPQTIKQLEKGLGISVKKYLNSGPGGEVMEGLQELTDQVRLLVEKVGKEGSINPALPDVAEGKGGKAQVVKAISDLQNRMDKVENGIANPGPAEDEIEPEQDTPDQTINKLLIEHEDLKKEGTFKNFDDFWSGESKEERRFKAQLLVDICNECDDLELDAFEQVKGGLLTSKTTRAEAIRDTIIEFCTDDISRDEAQNELEKYFKPANPGEDEDDQDFSEDW